MSITSSEIMDVTFEMSTMASSRSCLYIEHFVGTFVRFVWFHKAPGVRRTRIRKHTRTHARTHKIHTIHTIHTLHTRAHEASKAAITNGERRK